MDMAPNSANITLITDDENQAVGVQVSFDPKFDKDNPAHLMATEMVYRYGLSKGCKEEDFKIFANSIH